LKTAISIADDLLQEADRTARKLGMSRSGLFSAAVHDYLRKRDAEQIVQQLNRVYGKEPASPAEKRTTSNIKSKFRSTIKDRW
jgi:metal-responsive CopG/Arc/MetJ family transcriptional regulator